MRVIRYLGNTLAAVLAATLLSAAPAWAAPSDQPGGTGYYAGHTQRTLYVACVTTTWRAAYWNRDKTRVGERCYKADRSTWIPKAWPLVGWVTVRGERRPVYLRTV